MKFLITCRLWKTEGDRTDKTDNQSKYELDSSSVAVARFVPQFKIGKVGGQVFVTTAIAF